MFHGPLLEGVTNKLLSNTISTYLTLQQMICQLLVLTNAWRICTSIPMSSIKFEIIALSKVLYNLAPEKFH